MEVFVDPPPDAPRGVAIVAHPQPLLGGSAQHKIPQLLGRALRDDGWLSLRPNFRGVGASQGAHDHGFGEAEDLLALAGRLRAEHEGLPLALVGFSFGAFVQARVARRLADAGRPAARVVLAGMPAGEVRSGRRFETPAAVDEALVIHGELDETVPLANVLDWARPQVKPVLVVPGADHFFTGKLPLLRSLTVSHLAGGL
ncbi:alpha/beta hydrolase [Azohydromonas caseinilytica]|uniref:Alpha/beta hydrolase n=1 Tax=Azohydromonas caseinilytica TaxID=2728836 RepID=A0A848F8T8_9BURK|nr:thioesterase domain-containing protein [Azohydromonas caseinilytica]NML15772.1 alpha/beta hydrolase [Azohydromonas caseinilytica]